MQTLKKIYKKLWKSLIRPNRQDYASFYLGPSKEVYEHTSYKRLDFPLQNAFDEIIHISVYFACDYFGNLSALNSYIIYCHTHSGSRTEGIGLLDLLIPKGISLIVFDFRANGRSEGNWVTLGYKEAADVSVVVDFATRELKAKKICLWGRSMGSAACLFFLSEAFRRHFDKKLRKKDEGVEIVKQSPEAPKNDTKAPENRPKKANQPQEKRLRKSFKWCNADVVDCFVSDAGLIDLRKTIVYLVKSRHKSIPQWLITMVVAIIDKEIKKKTDVSLNDISPARFAKHVTTPVMFLLGRNKHISTSFIYKKMVVDLLTKRQRGRNDRNRLLIQTARKNQVEEKANQAFPRPAREPAARAGDQGSDRVRA